MAYNKQVKTIKTLITSCPALSSSSSLLSNSLSSLRLLTGSSIPAGASHPSSLLCSVSNMRCRICVWWRCCWSSKASLDKTILLSDKPKTQQSNTCTAVLHEILIKDRQQVFNYYTVYKFCKNAVKRVIHWFVQSWKRNNNKLGF